MTAQSSSRTGVSGFIRVYCAILLLLSLDISRSFTIPTPKLATSRHSGALLSTPQSSSYLSKSHSLLCATVPSSSGSSSSGSSGSSANDSVEDTSIIESSGSGPVYRLRKMSRLVYKFCRPHTIKGTILASSMGVVRALRENPSFLTRESLVRMVPRAIIGLVALLCGNAYIVGINQIYDEKIDEINKPFLPIAAKLLTKGDAWKFILTCIATGVAIVKTQFSPQIFFLYCVGIVLGTLYSVPPFYLKRFPLAAGGIIAFVRGFLLNYGVYYAVRESMGIPFRWNPVVTFVASFMTVFATVIAITKDLPDVEGDRQFDVQTFASKYGVKKVAELSSLLLGSAYVAAIALPLTRAGSSMFKVFPMVAGHSAFLAYFIWSYRRFEPEDMTSLKRFYKSIWNLFYLEYCLYPFI